MKLHISQEVYFNTEDGYYYIVGNNIQFITEEDAIEYLN